jgi:hypothetical protein
MGDADATLYDMDSAVAGLKSGVYTRFAGCRERTGAVSVLVDWMLAAEFTRNGS